jgi:uncharacterized protein (DUF1800 family)
MFPPLTRALIFSAACAASATSPAAPVSTAAPDDAQLAEHVLNRLAYGPKPGDVERVRRIGVAAYIDEQLHPAAIPLPPALQDRLAALETAQAPAGAALGAFLEARKQRKDEGPDAAAKRKEFYTRMTVQTEEARIDRAIDSPRQLEEVMVDFWYNHFNVFIGKGIDRALVASYERDAIRPNALGSFRALLGATARHPAMLYYLDNWLSTSNDFIARGKAGGQKAKSSGLNENYARELMELHTLGVDGGYTQKDVTELARMLTGWTYDNRDLVRSNVTFAFDARRHDHGDKEWLGRHVTDAGQAEGEHALDLLAMHPATAHHISYELAQYFVQDNPPPALVERMAATWMSSQGDISAVLRTLFTSPEFTAPAAIGAKFKTPYQYAISAIRASGVQITKVEPVLGALNRLGMPLYGCQTPDGYKNTQDAWLNPDALSRRIAYASTLVGYAPALDAAQLEDTLGTTISPQTRALVAGGPEKLKTAMILGSPDFMQH